MTTPRDPRHDNAANRPDALAERVRASLARRALDAPDAGLVAERVLHAADRSTARPARRRHAGWGPSLAAALVLLVIGGVVVAVTSVGSSSGRGTVAATAGSTSSSRPAPSPAPASTSPVAVPPPVAATTAPPSGPVTLRDLTVDDLTFDGTDSGWALGSADCLSGQGRCTALLHTSDGRSWQPRPGAQFNVPGVNGCASPCVSHIRFATPTVGYAYGDAFFLTTDGGAHWVQQDSKLDVVALESLDGNVVRIVSSGSGCPGPCDVRVQTSAIGSTTWTTRSFGRAADAANYEVYLVRGGSDVYLLFTGHVAGGAQSAASSLYRSQDDGVTWRSSGEVCRQGSGPAGEVDSTSIAASTGGRVVVLCTARSGGQTSVEVSADHGASFAATGDAVPAADAEMIAGDVDTVLVTAGTGLARSVDAGQTWTTVPNVGGQISFVGFESPTVGRALGNGGRTIWTTRDGGRTWTPTRVGLG